MPPDLWARFEVPPGLDHYPTLGDKFHLLNTFRAHMWGVLPLACLTGVPLGYPVQFLRELSDRIEHRKKCPACCEYWMKRRQRQQPVKAHGGGR